jgi:hypothetical protein
VTVSFEGNHCDPSGLFRNVATQPNPLLPFAASACDIGGFKEDAGLLPDVIPTVPICG